MGYPMDCPQRDERLGWFGDAMVSMEEAQFNFDMPAFYHHWLNGVRLNQNGPNGDISIVSPRPYMSLRTGPDLEQRLPGDEPGSIICTTATASFSRSNSTR